MMNLKKIFMFLWGFLLLAAVAHPQEKPKHEPKVYVSPEDKMFWPKDMPVYVRLSSSPDDGDAGYLMRSESTAQYADPYYFDTEGVNYIRTRHAIDKKTGMPVYPPTEVVWEVYRDGTPPVTEIAYNKIRFLRQKGKVHATPGLEAVLSSADAMSGVESIFYSLDQAPYAPYKSPLVFSEEKEYLLKFYAVDNVGNAEEEKSVSIIIDNTPPKSAHSFAGDVKDGTVSGRAILELTSDDSLTGVKAIYYRIDDQPEKTYDKPVHLSTLPEGEHSIAYYGMDHLDRQEQERIVHFFIDNTPPIITSDLLGDNFISGGKEYSSGRTRVKLTAIDNKAGVNKIYYSINGGEPQEYDSPFFLSGAQGSQKINYYAVDHVGNKSSSAIGSENISTPYLDLTGPELSYNIIGPRFTARDTLFVSDKSKIDLRAIDPESGLQRIVYKINQSEEILYDEPFSVDREGLCQIVFYGYDNVNNSSKYNFSLVVDKKAPEIFPVLSGGAIGTRTSEYGALGIYPAYSVLFLAATDSVAGFEKLHYSINGGKENEYLSPLKGFVKGTLYQIMVSADDKVGNKKISELKFYIEE